MLGTAIGLFVTDPISGYQLRRAAAALRGEPPPRIEAPDFTGYPSRILDGDTFDFGPTRIRLHGVDTPEMPTRQGQAAKDALAALVNGSGGLSCLDTGKRTYGRVVALCVTAHGRDLSALLAEQGWGQPMLGLGGWAYAPAWVRGMWGRR